MYVELRCRSAYSFLEGASLPEELAAQAEALGYRALGLTDRNGVYGSMELARQASGRGVQPITGAEVTLAEGSDPPGAPAPGSAPPRENRLALLAESREGYAHLCRLLTHAHLRSERHHPRLPRALLASHAAGLLLLVGGRQSDVGQAAARGEWSAAESLLRRYRDWFGERCLVELQQNYSAGDTARNRVLVELARRLELETVATGAVYYHHPRRHRLQDALTAVRHRTTLDGAHPYRLPNREFALRPPAAAARLFAPLPRALRNTEWVAERCRGFDLTQDLGYTFPDFRPLAGAAGQSAEETLERLCRALLAERYGRQPAAARAAARCRLEEELELIRYHRLSGFFLVYRDLLELARELAARVRGGRPRGLFPLPPGRGRGSSVSSLVCYLIGLSPVDPIQARLSLGRFLNRELASIPDIDLDFPRDIREELLKEVHRRYGEEHVAMVAAFPTYRVRSAIRDLGLALGLPPAEVDRLARLSEGAGAETVGAEMERLPHFAALRDAPAWRHLPELAAEVRGFPRHLSQHSGGVIISSCPLVELVPMEHSRMEGRRICQWDKDSCDDARFVKIDFLALGMLSAVEESLDLIAANGKPPVDLSRIDLEDAAVYERICRGDTVGVFQIESRAQIQMLPRTQPRNLEDLAVEVAIVRPGPIVGGAVNPYVRTRERLRHNPQARPRYDHPLLEPVLRDTLGVILFQDDVLAVCQALAGFSVGRAEALRRAMSRKRSREAIEQFRAEFLAGAAARGVETAVAERVFEKVSAFSEYGFPKSHAAAFAVLAYQSAWLCHYYPAEFVAALLNNQPMGFYPRDALLKDAQRHGVRFLRPDVNESAENCTVAGNAVRLGLDGITGLGRQGAQRLVAARAAGPFRSLPDLLRRVALPCSSLERLVLAGACNCFGLDRRALLWQLGVVARAQGWKNPRLAGSGSLARRRQTALELPPAAAAAPSILARQTPWEALMHDYRLLQLSPDAHPLALLRPALPKGMLTVAQLGETPVGRQVWVAGMVVARQRPGTARGFLFLLLEDETGLANAVVSPALYEQRRAILRGEALVWLRGAIERRGSSLNLVAAAAGSLTGLLSGAEEGPRTPAAPPAETPRHFLAALEELRAALPEPHQWR